MQLVDELSMIYTTGLMLWATFEHKQAQPFPTLLGIFIFGLLAFITGYYHFLKDPTFHQNAYAILTAIVLFRSVYVMEVSLRPYFRRQHGAHSLASKSGEDHRADERDLKIVKQMWIMIIFGLSVFLGGFAIWNLDNIHCSKLRRWRHEAGLPWGIFLEGHGWWHLMTGLGAYMYIVSPRSQVDVIFDRWADNTYSNGAFGFDIA
jgi:dihydroceramidase